MAFVVKFGKSDKRVNSTKKPTLSETTTCVLKSGTSVEKPTFILQGVSPFDWNVAYCETFGRYYFVNDISYVESTYEISCTCDYLASYKDEILSNSMYVTRSSNVANFNRYLIDNMFPTTAQPTISQSTATLPTSTTGSILCCIIGNGENSFLSLHPATFKAVTKYLYSPDYLNGLNTILETPKDVQKEIVRPQDYLQSAIWVPFNVTDGTPTQIVLGYVSTDYSGRDVGTGEVFTHTVSLAIPHHPESEIYGYMLYEPFTYYILTLPFIGTMRLSAKELANIGELMIKYSVDINGAIFVTVKAGSVLLFTATGNCGAPVSYSSRSTNVIGTVSSAINAAFSFATHNILGGASAIASGISSIAPTVETSGGSGGTMVGSNVIALRAIFANQPNRDYEHFGYPVCKKISLSGLSGFLQCENADVMCSATENGKEVINNFLNGGMFIE
jgi:hypothetical protein|nr:MAG TPA: hypothetical protein [Caudoviricetes sp.]